MPGTAPADDITAGQHSQPRPGQQARVLDFARRKQSPTAPAPAGATGPDATRRAAVELWQRAFLDSGLDLADPHTARSQQTTLGFLGVLVQGAVTEWENNTGTGIPPEIAERLYDLLYTGVQASSAPPGGTEPASG